MLVLGVQLTHRLKPSNASVIDILFCYFLDHQSPMLGLLVTSSANYRDSAS